MGSWDEAWRVKEATTPHLRRYIPRWCGPGWPYARPRVLAVEVEAAGLISWSPGCSGGLRKVSTHTVGSLQDGHSNGADLAGAHHCVHRTQLRAARLRIGIRFDGSSVGLPHRPRLSPLPLISPARSSLH